VDNDEPKDLEDAIQKGIGIVKDPRPRSTRQWVAARALDATVSAVALITVPVIILFITAHLIEWAQTEPLVHHFLLWLIGAYLTLADIAIVFTLYSVITSFLSKHRPKE